MGVEAGSHPGAEDCGGARRSNARVGGRRQHPGRVAEVEYEVDVGHGRAAVGEQRRDNLLHAEQPLSVVVKEV